MRRTARLVWPCLALLTLPLLGGCGDDPPATSSKAKPRATKPKAASAAPAEPRIKITPDLFPSVPAAMETLKDGLVQNDRDKVLTSEGWLSLQKDKAVGPLKEMLQASDTSIEMQIAAARALGKVGPGAAPVLFETIDSESAGDQLKLKATESLSFIRPSNRAIVDRLVSIIGGEDPRMRQVAIQGLGRIGPPAKSSAELLNGILNDPEETETIRGEAKRAIKEVDPRKGLMGVAAPKK